MHSYADGDLWRYVDYAGANLCGLGGSVCDRSAHSGTESTVYEYTDWDMEYLALTYIPVLAEVTGTNPVTGSYRYYMGDHLGSVRGGDTRAG